MKRFLFEYQVMSTGSKGEFSFVSDSEKEARDLVKTRVADLEFVETEDVKVGSLIKTLDVNNRYFECEGCT